eukprot:CAMPEP_0174828226 /NCGR_PEP_ID=MMETSP1114-20130205/1203_1 /TAXON_ID=312471 /ORGANISM="Neobodo designis, Strain CCAP 1951/1" /LENGTH=507 /DNA_ID=CAMNT_0016061937 /DNA_START=201 /DNA_END=1724 /DNA_ORIENTATION=-
MPVIAAGIVTKLGRILVARCFMDVTRIRIEGLLSAFPKLLGSGTGKQTTFIDSGSVRYLYQPVEGMYLVTVTTKASNIMEDLATLRLLGRVIPEYCQSAITEESILDKAFEIMFAMDEVVTNGAREAATMEQVVTALEMRSEAEERARREEDEKKKDAQKVAKQKAKELKKKRQEMEFEGGGMGGGGGYGGPVPHDDGPSASHRFSEVATAEPEPVKPARKIGGGMSLSNKRKQDQAARVLAETGGSMPAKPAAPDAAAAAAAAAEEEELQANSHQVVLRVTEAISVALNREGGVNGVDIKGEMSVTIADPAAALVRIQMGALNNPDFTFKTHPNINKALFTGDNILAMKDSRPYPTNQSPSILKWRAQSLAKPPLSITCWPSDNGATIEFELENPQLTLEHVVLSLPLAGAFPEVSDISQGDFQHDSATSMLHWRIGTIDASETSGSMEVTLNQAADEAFFPASLQFTIPGSLAGVAVRDVCLVESGASVDFGVTARATTEQYIIE